MNQTKIFAANFKLNKNPLEMKEYFKTLTAKFLAADSNTINVLDENQFIFFPSMTNLESSAFSIDSLKSELAMKKKNFRWGSQNAAVEKSGAFTGESSAAVLKSMGAEYILVGHSERRSLFAETNETINKKLKLIKDLDLKAMLCIGETLDQRESGSTFDVLKLQLDAALDGLDNFHQFVIAYEPVWAIGTGKVATIRQIEEVHLYLRKYLDKKKLNGVSILYGGSVKPDNCKELIHLKFVDGFLIGGACLDPQSYFDICLSVIK